MEVKTPMADPFIVAEISGNHLGSFDRAITLIEAAASAGADAVKFQAYQAERMVVDQKFVVPDGPWKDRKLIDLYREAETPFDWFPTLFKAARANGLVPFASVFDYGGLAMLEKLDCPIYKISSFELTDLDLIAATARTGKPLIMSTGMATYDEIEEAVSMAKWARSGRETITLLQCVSAYPAKPEEANLRAMYRLGKDFECRAGVSDHTLSLGVSVAAVAMGACVVERHLTLRREDGGPDAAFSLDVGEFATMSKACREAKAAQGSARFGPTPGEHSSLIFRRGLWSTTPILAGQVFSRDNIATARPCLGVPAGDFVTILHRIAARDVPAGVPITEDMVRRLAREAVHGEGKIEDQGDHPKA